LRRDNRKLIKASEIGEYVFCARAWRLRLDGYEPTSGQRARRAGTKWHLTALLSAVLTIIVAVLLFLLWYRK
jgi:hypothetical protein